VTRRRASVAAASLAAAALAAAALAACGGGARARERAARARADSLEAVIVGAEREGRAFRGTVGGRRVALLVEGCKVYDLGAPGDARGEPVLVPDPYPWPTVCQREHARADSAWVTVTLGRMAFGAGGCCATGGTYRSRDGRVWERELGEGRWAPVDTGDAR
jgi:hypothetical protein